jgi:hypothetical protein
MTGTIKFLLFTKDIYHEGILRTVLQVRRISGEMFSVIEKENLISGDGVLLLDFSNFFVCFFFKGTVTRDFLLVFSDNQTAWALD